MQYILSLDEKTQRSSFLRKAFKSRTLVRRPAMALPADEAVILMPMNDASQRGRGWAALQLDFPDDNETVAANGAPIQSAAFIHVQRIEAVFRANDNALLGYIVYWASTIAPHMKETLKRYRQASATQTSPYNALKKLAAEITTLDDLRPLRVGTFLGAFARLKKDGNETTEYTWSTRLNLEMHAAQCGAWNRKYAQIDLLRRFRNWRNGLSTEDPQWERSAHRVDIPNGRALSAMDDHWYRDDGESLSRPRQVHDLIQMTISQASLSLLHTLARVYTSALSAQGILPGRIPRTIMAQNPVARAQTLRGSVTILMSPQEVELEIIDED